MAATVIAQPVTPASAYRPLQFQVQRTDPSGNLIIQVFIADATDASTIGSGEIEVGDVVVEYTSSIFGSVPVAIGQTILLDADCGPYAGVQMITSLVVVTGTTYLVIDAEDAGDFTPAASTGAMKVWLDNYRVYLRVLTYLTAAGAPVIDQLEASPYHSGIAYLNADIVVREHFTHRIEQLAKAVPGGVTLAQDAHRISALFYRVWITEAYDTPGAAYPDPFDGAHNVYLDDVSDLATIRVAVNGVHPFAGEALNWSTAGMGSHEVGTNDDFLQRFMTDAPAKMIGAFAGRSLEMGVADRFRVHMLTNASTGHEVDYTLRVIDRTGGVSGSVVGTVPLDLGSLVTSAFSIAIGPADLAPFMTVPDAYAVYVSNVAEDGFSEPFEISVQSGCTENRRVLGGLNPLGGYDTYTFTGREFEEEEAKRAIIQKPYGTGTGYDFTERTYRNEPMRPFTVSSAPISNTVRKWIARFLSRSPNVLTIQNAIVCPAIITSKNIPSSTTGPYNKPVTVDFRLGVENLAQQA